jgi:hypothetical protein
MMNLIADIKALAKEASDKIVANLTNSLDDKHVFFAQRLSEVYNKNHYGIDVVCIRRRREDENYDEDEDREDSNENWWTMCEEIEAEAVVLGDRTDGMYSWKEEFSLDHSWVILVAEADALDQAKDYFDTLLATNGE